MEECQKKIKKKSQVDGGERKKEQKRETNQEISVKGIPLVED